MKVAPNGRPSCLNLSNPWGGLLGCIVVERRNSCVTATPIDANDNDVRNQARYVRSLAEISQAYIENT